MMILKLQLHQVDLFIRRIRRKRRKGLKEEKEETKLIN
jgi:hypothetical protein